MIAMTTSSSITVNPLTFPRLPGLRMCSDLRGPAVGCINITQTIARGSSLTIA